MKWSRRRSKKQRKRERRAARRHNMTINELRKRISEREG